MHVCVCVFVTHAYILHLSRSVCVRARAQGPLASSSNPYTGVGRQLSSTKREAPQYGFGTNDRWYTRKMAIRHGQTPAPGAYNI